MTNQKPCPVCKKPRQWCNLEHYPASPHKLLTAEKWPVGSSAARIEQRSLTRFVVYCVSPFGSGQGVAVASVLNYPAALRVAVDWGHTPL